MSNSQGLLTILASQEAWAQRREIERDSKGRSRTLGANLFQPLSDATKAEFDAGAGDELSGDMRSLRSSSALAVNVFDPWREWDLAPLHRVLGGGGDAKDLSFERKLPAGVRGQPPHLDVVLDGPGARAVGIESKFAEIYSPAHNTMRDSYVERTDLWRNASKSLTLARSINNGEHGFRHLGAAQLLKHALGLRKAFGLDGFRLVYLWFDSPCDESRIHREEVTRFAAIVEGEIDFAAMTYQEFGPVLGKIVPDRKAYLHYLSDRYGFVEAED